MLAAHDYLIVLGKLDCIASVLGQRESFTDVRSLNQPTSNNSAGAMCMSLNMSISAVPAVSEEQSEKYMIAVWEAAMIM